MNLKCYINLYTNQTRLSLVYVFIIENKWPSFNVFQRRQQKVGMFYTKCACIPFLLRIHQWIFWKGV